MCHGVIAYFINLILFEYFFSKLWRAIPNVSGRRLSKKNIWKEDVPSYYPSNMNQMWLKLTDISRSENGGFSIVCEKCHVSDVTVGGASVVSTSDFRFPVGHNLSRSRCSGKFLVVAYFRRERCWKVGKKFVTFHFYRVPLGLSGAVVFFSIAINNKRWGKRR